MPASKPATTKHNYIARAVAFLQSKNLPPQLSLLTVAHDDWCDMLNGQGCCNCEPDFIVKQTPQAEDN